MAVRHSRHHNTCVWIHAQSAWRMTRAVSLCVKTCRGRHPPTSLDRLLLLTRLVRLHTRVSLLLQLLPACCMKQSALHSLQYCNSATPSVYIHNTRTAMTQLTVGNQQVCLTACPVNSRTRTVPCNMPDHIPNETNKTTAQHAATNTSWITTRLPTHPDHHGSTEHATHCHP